MTAMVRSLGFKSDTMFTIVAVIVNIKSIFMYFLYGDIRHIIGCGDSCIVRQANHYKGKNIKAEMEIYFKEVCLGNLYFHLI
jgi:hypothetical protein